jgi:hypothetical protein
MTSVKISTFRDGMNKNIISLNIMITNSFMARQLAARLAYKIAFVESSLMASEYLL